MSDVAFIYEDADVINVPSAPSHRIYAINHSGEHVVREINPLWVWFGTTDWHKKPQFFCHVYDHEKHDFRDFACSGIYKWEKL